MRYVDLGPVVAQNEKNREVKPRFKKRKVLAVLVILFLGVAGVFSAVKREGFSALLNPVSIVSGFVNPVNLNSTDGRVNILLLGVDRRATQKEGGLTDTILVASVGKEDKNVIMVSLPRDLWVARPGGGYGKINSVYAFEGTDATKKVVEDVLGFPIHYYVLIDFKALKK